MLRRGCRAACASCLLPVILVAAALGFVYHQLTTAPAYAAVVPSPDAAIQASVGGAVARARRQRAGVASVQLSDAEVTTLLRLAAGTSPPFTNLSVHLEPRRLVVTGTLRPAGQRVVVSGQFLLQPAGGVAVALQPERMSIGQIGLPGALDHLVATALPGQFDLPRVGGPQPLDVLCVGAGVGRLLLAVRLPGPAPGGSPSAAAICAGPGG